MRMETRLWTAARCLGLLLAVVVATAAGVAGAQTKPVTVPALELMPKQTALAIGLPPVTVLREKLVPTLNMVAPELELEAALDDFIGDFAEDFDIEGAASLADIGAGIGVDFEAPVGIFVDLSPSLDSLKAFIDKLEEAEESPDLAPEDVIAEHMEIPALSAVIRISDKALAEATIARIGDMSPEFDPEGYENIAAGDITVRSWGADIFNYFLTDDALVLGNSLDMVANTAMRLSDPAELRYGTDPDVPKVSNDEIVALIYGSDFIPPLLGVLNAFMAEQDPAMAKLYAAQSEMLMAIWGDEGEDDPMLVSMGIDGNRFEIMSRLDTATHPAVLEQSGAAVPLKLAPKLSEDTLFMFSVALTPEMKETLTGTYLEAVAPQLSGDPAMAQGLTMGRQVLQMIGPEISVGLSAVTDDLPALTLMVQLTNPPATQGLLQLFVPTMPAETYNDVEISDIVAGIPVQLSIAYVDDMVLVSSNIDEMKRIIDLCAADAHSPLFASLDPPLDPARPRYSAFVLKTALWTDVIQPLTVLFGGVPDEADMVAGALSEKVSEVRMLSEMDGSWTVSSLSLFLKDVPETGADTVEVDVDIDVEVEVSAD